MPKSALPICMSVYHVFAVPVKAREDAGCSGGEHTDCCGCWELRLCPPEEVVLLTTDSSLQPQVTAFLDPSFSFPSRTTFLCPL